MQSDAELMLRLMLKRRLFVKDIGEGVMRCRFNSGRETHAQLRNGLPVLTPELRAELERLDKGE